MSMPPQGPGGPPNNNPYGHGGPPQDGWNQGGWNQPQGSHGGDQNQNAGQGGWDQNHGQPAQDPYQQQYDAYTQPSQGYPQGGPGYPTEHLQTAYGQAPMGAPTGPAGPGWNEPPKKGNNKLPWIVGGAIVVVGAIVAVIILVTGKDGDKSASGADSTTGQTQTDSGDAQSEAASDESSAASDESDPSTESDQPDQSDQSGSDDSDSASASDSGSGGGGGGASSSLPAGFPVPASVAIDDGSTYCAGTSCFGSFEADDPEAAYYDWVSELESAGYTITTQEITGSGSNAIWAIEAAGELEIILYWAGTGVLTSS